MLVGALAVAQVVEEVAGAPAAIKWPNDVLLDGRKVAGILGELRDTLVVLGIGVNVNQTEADLPAAARAPRLCLSAPSPATHMIGPRCSARSWRGSRAPMTRWLVDGLAELREEIERRDALRGREVEVEGRRGVAVGIDDDGRLELEAGGERIAVSSGEVTV